jgi:hypothetical protein
MLFRWVSTSTGYAFTPYVALLRTLDNMGKMNQEAGLMRRENYNPNISKEERNVNAKSNVSSCGRGNS